MFSKQLNFLYSFYSKKYFYYIIEVIQENYYTFSRFIVKWVRECRFCTKSLPDMHEDFFPRQFMILLIFIKASNKERRKIHFLHHKISAITGITYSSCLTALQTGNYREKFGRCNAITLTGLYPGI